MAGGSFGLRPVRRLDGTAWNGATVTCLIGSDIATDLFVGDPVVNTTAGAAQLGVTANYLLTGGIDNMEGGGAYPVVTIATAASTNRIYGVIVGFEANRSNLGVNYGAASTVRIARVALADPYTVFEVCGDGAGTPLTLADVGRTVSLVATAGGSTSTGYSGWDINDDTNTTTTLQCLIVGVSNKIGNIAKVNSTTVTTDKAVWEVVIAQPSVFPLQFGLGV